MVESRWLRWIGPGVVALGAVGFIASTTLGAGVRPWVPSACAGPPSDRIAAARDRRPDSARRPAREPWFRLDPVLDGDGRAHWPAARPRARWRAGRPVAWTSPRRSFAAGPFGGIVLVGSDDGAASRVQADRRRARLRVADRRRARRHPPRDDRPAGTFIYEMRVDRASRADLGIWRRAARGGSTARHASSARRRRRPLRADLLDRVLWDLAGDRLAVQSCGEIACRIRVIDAAVAVRP